jgi:hypothetical protein
MLGDQGVIVSWVVTEATQFIRPNPPFFEDVIFLSGTLFRQATLSQIEVGGNDRLLGDAGADWMHGGAGDDLMNGNAGNDRLFGDRGADAIWGGLHHDHLWGGHGDDYLDVLPRQASVVEKGKHKGTLLPADPPEWFEFAQPDNFEHIDYIYGGWDRDAMQADVASPGPVPGDRLIDWVGAYNVYYVCPGAYGERVITRSPSPSVRAFLEDLAWGDGAFDPAIPGTSGYDEVGLVYIPDIRHNAHPPHPDNPGHFTCAPPTTSAAPDGADLYSAVLQALSSLFK